MMDTYETISINYVYYIWITGFFTGIMLCMFFYIFTYVYIAAQKTNASKLPIETAIHNIAHLLHAQETINIGKLCEEIDKIYAIIGPIVDIICEQYKEYKSWNTKRNKQEHPFHLSNLLDILMNVAFKNKTDPILSTQNKT